MPALAPAQLDQLRSLISRERLVRDTLDLCSIYSRTGEAKGVLDRLAELLAGEGFAVERPDGGYAAAPAVAVRFSSGKPGPTIQFNGHLDTVHLPFVPPQHHGDRITGSGSCDMKGGTVAAIEALRIVRESGALTKGSILFTAHDLHEAPWGDGTQLEGLIRQGYCGDAVLIPEYLNGCIPTAGRGLAIWKLTIRRPGAPVHEVLRPLSEPSVIDAGAEMIARLRQYGTHLASKTDPVAGPETVFVGQAHSGEIYNQYPQEFVLEGTRRWLPGESRYLVEEEFRRLVQQVADRTKTTIDIRWQLVRDGFRLDTNHRFVKIFEDNYTATSGKTLPYGPKAFCDDCNAFWSLADIPGITHGPNSAGAHTMEEWVSIDDMARVAQLYAATALQFCNG